MRALLSCAYLSVSYRLSAFLISLGMIQRGAMLMFLYVCFYRVLSNYSQDCISIICVSKYWILPWVKSSACYWDYLGLHAIFHRLYLRAATSQDWTLISGARWDWRFINRQQHLYVLFLASLSRIIYLGHEAFVVMPRRKRTLLVEPLGSDKHKKPRKVRGKKTAGATLTQTQTVSQSNAADPIGSESDSSNDDYMRAADSLRYHAEIQALKTEVSRQSEVIKQLQAQVGFSSVICRHKRRWVPSSCVICFCDFVRCSAEYIISSSY